MCMDRSGVRRGRSGASGAVRLCRRRGSAGNSATPVGRRVHVMAEEPPSVRFCLQVLAVPVTGPRPSLVGQSFDAERVAVAPAVSGQTCASCAPVGPECSTRPAAASGWPGGAEPFPVLMQTRPALFVRTAAGSSTGVTGCASGFGDIGSGGEHGGRNRGWRYGDDRTNVGMRAPREAAGPAARSSCSPLRSSFTVACGERPAGTGRCGCCRARSAWCADRVARAVDIRIAERHLTARMYWIIGVPRAASILSHRTTRASKHATLQTPSSGLVGRIA
jgi:hypothetical protein